MKILIVEDDESTRADLIRLLKAKGYEIDYATNGEEALKVIQTQKFDGILADLNMPKMGGLELAELLGGEPPFGLYTTGQDHKWINILAKKYRCAFFQPEASLEKILNRAISTFKQTVIDHSDATKNLMLQ